MGRPLTAGYRVRVEELEDGAEDGFGNKVKLLQDEFFSGHSVWGRTMILSGLYIFMIDKVSYRNVKQIVMWWPL